jgi:hypothetical protein
MPIEADLRGSGLDLAAFRARKTVLALQYNCIFAG